jgi:sugar-specific transcriptional regulator TrmB
MDKLKFFQSLEFSNYESKVINSLLRLKIATTKEISFDSGVPQNKLYSILNKFENLGIVEIIPEKLKKFRPINLETFIQKKIKTKEAFLKELKSSSKSIKHLKESDEKNLFSIIKGQQAIMDKLAENNSSVKKEIYAVQRNWRIWGKGLREIEKAVKRGVDVRLIGIVNSETKNRALEWKKTGAKIRIFNEKFGESPLRFSIFDSKEARITIGRPEIPDRENYITIWTTSKPMINVLKKQFLEMWKESKNF